MMAETIKVSTDKQKLDVEMIHRFLKNAYWAKGRTKSKIQTTIDNSICFGVYQDDNQIGFARVVSDTAIFAYLMDVFILPEYRGNGYGILLMDYIINYPKIKDVDIWMLATSDAHGLYSKFGFTLHPNPDKVMKRVNVPIFVQTKLSSLP